MVNDDHHVRIGKVKVDPLTDTPEAGRALFNKLSHECGQFPMEAVVDAAANLLLNVMRQRNKTRNQAEGDFDAMFGKLKAVLLSHYDGVSGNRRSIFPFHQVIYPPFIRRNDKQ